MRHRILVPLLSDPGTLRESEAIPAGEGRFRLVGRATGGERLQYKSGEIVECSILILPDGSKGLVATRSMSSDPEFRSRRTVYAISGAMVGALLGAAIALCVEFTSTSALIGSALGAPALALSSIRWGDAVWDALSSVVRWFYDPTD
jgi:hypothetical protein